MANALVKLSAVKSAPKLQKNDLVVVPFTLSKGAKKPTALVSADLPEESLADFKGKFGEVLIVYVHGARTALLGLGDPDKLDDEKVRVAYGILIAKARTLQVKRILLHSADLVSAEAALEGALLASYTFEGYQSEKGPVHLSEVVWVGEKGPSKNDLSRLYALAHGVFLARDLTNHNADDVTPQHLVHIARTLAKKYSAVKTTIFNKKRLEKEKFGLLLAVSRGAHVEPALIIASYKGNPKAKEHTVIVGKGVTYDTGGLNLKTNMLTMKGDMAGAAACLGLLTAAAEAKLKANFTIVIPSTENSIGERSYKPGDVYKSYLGKTVEIGNTDAEGRLILADALAYASKHLKPTRLVDLATLTGAMLIALGHEVTGMMASDDTLAEDLLKAGETSGERLCRLPLIPELKADLKSDIADINNVGGREAGSIKAALFLQEFVGDVPWAHLDIAGTAYRPAEKGYLPKHATGVGVRLLMDLLA